MKNSKYIKKDIFKKGSKLEITNISFFIGNFIFSEKMQKEVIKISSK